MKSNVMPDGWVSLVAADSFDQLSTLGKSIKTKDCSSSGKYPVVDQGQELITGYIDDLSRVIEVESPIVLFGDHTRAVKWIDFNFVPGADGTKLLKPKIFINNRFSYYQLKSLDIPDKGYARHFKYLKELSFVIPPLAEQQVIADKLDTLLAQVESIRARLEHIPDILKQFRQSVLTAAVSGELTEVWRANKQSKFEIDSLTNEKLSLIKAKLVKKDLHVEVGEEIFDLPEGWETLALQSFATKITDGEHSTPKRESSGHYLLSARNVRDGFLDLSNVDYVGNEEFLKLRKRCDPDEGDILISCSGSVGRISLVDRSNKYVMVRSAALVKIMHQFLNNKYLMYVLQSPLSQKQIEEKSKSTAQANLFLSQIKELSIPCPSIEEQMEIVRLIDHRFTVANSIEKQVHSALDRVSNLTQSILAKSFRGELTAEWREANPELISGENSAEALLERIKAERELAKPATKRGRGKA
ncbi:restriction endonuclease subunit S [Acinetobacter nosocomialis]|uniref:restriction endonuclease subunit S n=1 Tax=Acinetobacter nosocomialis TaxID=106654 RepID=UPI0005EBB5F2|nr:restriction endonuclease subunit S [Acinetobacter nosocomialis]